MIPNKLFFQNVSNIITENLEETRKAQEFLSTFSVLETSSHAPQGFLTHERLSEDTYYKREGDNVTLYLSQESIHEMPAVVFDHLCEISLNYFKVDYVAPLDLFIWEYHSLLKELKLVVTSRKIENKEEIIRQLDLLETRVAAWLGWICLLKQMPLDKAEKYLAKDRLRYALMIQGNCSFYTTQDSLNIDFQASRAFFEKTFKLKKGKTSLDKDFNRCLQELRQKLLGLIECTQACLQDDRMIELSHNMPMANCFNYGLSAEDFSIKYKELIESYLIAYERLRLNTDYMRDLSPRENVIPKLQTNFSSTKEKLRWIIKTSPANDFVKKSFHERKNAYDSYPEFVPSLHQTALGLEAYDTIWLYESNNFYRGRDNQSFMSIASFMIWVELLEKPELSLSGIPEVLSDHPVLYKFFLSIARLVDKFPTVSQENMEPLKGFYHAMHHSIHEDGQRVIFADYFVQFLLKFESYCELADFVENAKIALNNGIDLIDAADLSLSQAEALCEFCETNAVFDQLQIAERLISSFEFLALPDHSSDIAVLSFHRFLKKKEQEIREAETLDSLGFVKEVNIEEFSLSGDSSEAIAPSKISFENKEEGLPKAEIQDNLAAVEKINIEKFSLSGDSSEASVPFQMSLENKEEELRKAETQDNLGAVEGVDNGEFFFLEKKQKNSSDRFLGGQKLIKNRDLLIDSSSSSKESSFVLPSKEKKKSPKLMIEETKDYEFSDVLENKNLFKRLRDPRKMTDFLKEQGLQIIRHSKHTIFGLPSGKTLQVPHHPGKDISTGVRHSILSSLKDEKLELNS